MVAFVGFADGLRCYSGYGDNYDSVSCNSVCILGIDCMCAKVRKNIDKSHCSVIKAELPMSY